MDKLKTRVLFIALIILALVSVSAVAAADVDDVVSVEQDDIDLSEETITDVEDTSDDTQEVDDVADTSNLAQSNSQDVLKADDDEEGSVTITFKHLKTSGWVTDQKGPFTYSGTNGNWLKASSQGYSLPMQLTYQGKQYTLLYWEGPSVADHPIQDMKSEIRYIILMNLV